MAFRARGGPLSSLPVTGSGTLALTRPLAVPAVLLSSHPSVVSPGPSPGGHALPSALLRFTHSSLRTHTLPSLMGLGHVALRRYGNGIIGHLPPH